jgi:hypothetical protein
MQTKDKQPVAAIEGAWVLAVFSCAERAEETVNNLHRAGFGAAGVSVMARDDSTIRANRLPWWIRLRAELTGMAVVSVPGLGRVVALRPDRMVC